MLSYRDKRPMYKEQAETHDKDSMTKHEDSLAKRRMWDEGSSHTQFSSTIQLYRHSLTLIAVSLSGK